MPLRFDPARAAILLLAMPITLACGGGGSATDAGSDSDAPDAAVVTCESDADCSDGLFCTGVESCEPTAADADSRGCVAAVDPCAAAETCDEDTDSCVTDGCTETDADGDGAASVACGGDDCDDEDANSYPGNAEICDADDHDEDCDPRTFGFRDSDSDGVADAQCCNVDADGVRQCGTDCNDAAPGTNPTVPEVCDGLDNDCDELVDEGVLETFYLDGDEDSYGDPDGATMLACFRPEGYADRADDCDDMRSDVNPVAPELCDVAAADENCDGDANPAALCFCTGDETRLCALPGSCAAGTQRCVSGSWGGCSIAPVSEVCNGIDDDCDGMVDELLTVTCYADTDDDGYAPSAAEASEQCPVGGRGAVGGCPFNFTNREPLATDVDCDADDTLTYPGAPEVCDAARADESCNGVANEGCVCDGAATRPCPAPGVCSTGTQTCSEGDWAACSISAETEVCNLRDDDCDGMTDELLTITCYDDADDDGYALSGAASREECPVTGRGSVGGCPFGLTNREPTTAMVDEDCDDTLDYVFPGAAEICDTVMVDEDCDGAGNEDCSCDGAESRGCPELGVCSAGSQTCAGGTWGACSISAVAEVCNSADDNCDGSVDEGTTIPCWLDGDGDSYAVMGAVFIDACACPLGYTSREPVGVDVDCDDMLSLVSPVGVEDCDGVDDDCDGMTDEGLPVVPRYVDSDGDGARGFEVMRCEGDPNSVAVPEDCDETSTSIYIGAPELCDRIDNDCSEGGLLDIAEDGDDDGFTAVGYTGCTGGPLPRTDCDDTDDTSYPGATELCDGADNDCNMVVDEPAATAVACASPTSYRVCALSDAVGANICTVLACMPGFADCNDITIDDGCETPTLTDPSNCGGCGVVCPAATVCDGGVCGGIVEEVAVGGGHGCVRRSNGRVACWGLNEDGQLGDGTTAPRAGPVEVAGLVDATQITAGTRHSCALRSGEVVCWGSNGSGRLGDGTTVDSPAPVAVTGLTDATLVVAGSAHTCAIVTGGAVVCWGENSNGELGDGTTVDKSLFATVTGITGAGSLSASLHSCVEVGGEVRCWGRGIEGQLGDGMGSSVATTPVVVTGITDATSVSTGGQHSCARHATGGVSCWGYNFFSQLGVAPMAPFTALVPVATGVTGAGDLPEGLGSSHTCTQLSNGEVRCWGRGGEGQLGMGGTPSATASAQTVVDPLSVDIMAHLDNVLQLDLAGRFGCALHPSRRVTCWGDNSSRQLANGGVTAALAPDDTQGINVMRTITGGIGHSMTLGVDGHVRSWGRNGGGQLGDGTTIERDRPIVVSSLDDAVQLSAGGDHSCVRRADGTAACWGSNGSGALGTGGGVHRIPEPVSGLTGLVDVQAGYSHACAVAGTGQVVCWGEGFYGQLGDGGMANSNVPVDVMGLVDGLRVAPGGRHSCALRRNGQVVCWGEGSAGQLGDGMDMDSSVPVDVMGLPAIQQITAGYDHTCARDTNGRVYCWGDGTSGQVGDGAGISRSTPVMVSIAAASVSAFYYHTCAVTEGVGAARCWGDGSNGQLGTGTAGEPSPVTVTNATSGATSIAAAESFSCGLMDGAPMCWGSNWFNQLGTGTGVWDDPLPEPYRVLDLP